MAFLIAVAVLIKITPLIFLLPVLYWRDWRWLRWFCGSLAALLAFMVLLKQGLPTLVFFASKVMPPMSGGRPDLDNKTLLSAIQVVWLHSPAFQAIVGPHPVVLFGKLLCVGIALYALLATMRLGRNLSSNDRVQVIAAFSLLSICLAPVSWQHAYAIGFLMLAVTWKRAFEGDIGPAFLLLLTVATVAVGSISFTGVAKASGPLFLIAYLASLLGIAISLRSLQGNRAMTPQPLQ